jgi:dTDP-4-amino-4,6-dideoxygalactose transaminase
MHYPSILEFSGFQGRFTETLPLTHEFASRAITLPLHPGLSFEEVDEITRILRAVH